MQRKELYYLKRICCSESVLPLTVQHTSTKLLSIYCFRFMDRVAPVNLLNKTCLNDENFTNLLKRDILSLRIQLKYKTLACKAYLY